MILHHPMTLETRGTDDDAIEFVASSGSPVQTRGGPEVLRVKGMDLARFRKNPVVLDTHQRGSSEDVIGSAAVRVEGQRLIASIKFASDEKSQRVRQKVDDGILRALSIGFTVDPTQIRELAEGEVDGDGDEEVHGPAIVVNRSELHEISIVPVPADEDALRRDFYKRCLMTEDERDAREFREAIAAATSASGRLETVTLGSGANFDVVACVPPAGTVHTGANFLAEGEGASTLAEAVTETAAEEVHIINLDAERMKRTAAALRASTDETKARTEDRAARQGEIRAVCPADLSAHLDTLLLGDPDMTFESARRALLEERNRTHKPVGTPEPAQINSTAPQSLDSGDLLKTLTGR